MWLRLMLIGVCRTQGGSFPPNTVHGEDYNLFHEFCICPPRRRGRANTRLQKPCLAKADAKIHTEATFRRFYVQTQTFKGKIFSAQQILCQHRGSWSGACVPRYTMGHLEHRVKPRTGRMEQLAQSVRSQPWTCPLNRGEKSEYQVWGKPDVFQSNQKPNRWTFWEIYYVTKVHSRHAVIYWVHPSKVLWEAFLDSMARNCNGAQRPNASTFV